MSSDEGRPAAMSSDGRRPPLAIVGLDAIFPGSSDGAGYWRSVFAGTDHLRDVPESHWLIDDYYDPDPTARDKTYGRRGGFLDEVEFEPLQWGIPPSIIPSTDTSQLLALIVAQRVLDDATAGKFREMDRSRISVILGVTGGQELLGSMVARLQRPVWERALRESGVAEPQVQGAVERILAHYVEWQESTFPGLLGNVVAGRIANRLDLGGTNCITDAACASSISALAMAASELYLGDSDLVITGGVDTMNDVFMYMCFSKTPALSPTGDCRPFSAAADGTMLGEGLGMIALKRLEDAERDGDAIYCVVRGIGSSSDGHATSVYAPLSTGQARAIRRAYDVAGFGPETVELVEAHGTGTIAGDAAEAEGLRTVFEDGGRRDGQWCALGSVKALIGHTKSAAGAAGMIKAILALRHRAIPPQPKTDQLNPALEHEPSPFYVPTAARPWVRGRDHERRAGVSSFGFGGSNFHVALSEYAGNSPTPGRFRACDAELVVVCGEPAEVAASARRLASEATEEGYLRWAGQTSLETYDAAAPARLAVVARDERDLAAKLANAADRIEAADPAGLPDFSLPGGVHLGTGGTPGPLAFLFPGQGSHYVGMGSGLALAFPAALEAWDLAASLDLALHDVVFPKAVRGPTDREEQARQLTATDWAQPAIGCVSLSMLHLLPRARPPTLRPRGSQLRRAHRAPRGGSDRRCRPPAPGQAPGRAHARRLRNPRWDARDRGLDRNGAIPSRAFRARPRGGQPQQPPPGRPLGLIGSDRSRCDLLYRGRDPLLPPDRRHRVSLAARGRRLRGVRPRAGGGGDRALCPGPSTPTRAPPPIRASRLRSGPNSHASSPSRSASWR